MVLEFDAENDKILVDKEEWLFLKIENERLRQRLTLVETTLEFVKEQCENVIKGAGEEA